MFFDTETRKIVRKSAMSVQTPRTFVHFILEPLYKLFAHDIMENRHGQRGVRTTPKSAFNMTDSTAEGTTTIIGTSRQSISLRLQFSIINSKPSQTIMTSTDSSQMNFNPSWMQTNPNPTIKNSDRANGFVNATDEEQHGELIEPVFANHRYGREDILALMAKDVKPPDGLNACPFFIEKPQLPIILTPLNETELRLQQNINSSKALSALSRQDRNFVNGNDLTVGSPNAAKWTVAGSNRGYHHHQPPNKPISNRWAPLGGSNSSNNEGGGFRSPRAAPSLFNRSGGAANNSGGPQRAPASMAASIEHSPLKSYASYQPPHLRAATAAVVAAKMDTSTNETGFSAASSVEGSSTPAIAPVLGAGQQPHNPWTQVGGGGGGGVSRNLSKTAESVRMLLASAGGGGNLTNIAIAGFDSNLARASSQLAKSSLSSELDLSSTEARFQPQQAAATGVKPSDGDAQNLAAPQPAAPTITPADIKWQYVDPNGTSRGPFDSKQMQAWFENGYFDSSLRVCRTGDKQFVTLGELFQINGAVTPFIVKSLSRPQSAGNGALNSGAAAKPAQNSQQSMLLDSVNIWAANASSQQSQQQAQQQQIGGDGGAFLAAGSNLKTSPEIELKRLLQEKEMAIVEEQRKLREKKEQLLREERERVEKERQMRQMELELQRRQEEVQRLAREKEEELEKRRIQVAEFERQRREALEKMEEQLRNEQMQQIREREEERLRLDAEVRRHAEAQKMEERRRADELRRQTEAEQRRLREEEEVRLRVAYEEARRLKEMAQRAEAEQRSALLAQQETRKEKEREAARATAAADLAQKRRDDEERRATAERRQREEEEEERERARRRQMEEELSRAAIQELLNAEQSPQKPKVSPWVTVGSGSRLNGKKEKPIGAANAADSTRGKSLLDIQREEEMALREQLKRQQEERVNLKQGQPPTSSGPWAKVADRTWTGTTPAVGVVSSSLAANRPGASRVIAGGGGVWAPINAPTPAEIPKASFKRESATTHHTKKQPPHNNTTTSAQQKKVNQVANKPGAIIDTKPPQDAFTTWTIKRVRELNSSVDAEVFAAFLVQIESPNEVEDYIEGYLGKVAKEFHREFMNKRIELRPRVQPTDKDDLSRPAAAINDVTGGSAGGSASASNNNNKANHSTENNNDNSGANNVAGAKGKKKKGKAQKIDPKVLGFRAAGDPNRFNAGEIDTEIPLSNRKR